MYKCIHILYFTYSNEKRAKSHAQENFIMAQIIKSFKKGFLHLEKKKEIKDKQKNGTETCKIKYAPPPTSTLSEHKLFEDINVRIVIINIYDMNIYTSR